MPSARRLSVITRAKHIFPFFWDRYREAIDHLKPKSRKELAALFFVTGYFHGRQEAPCTDLPFPNPFSKDLIPPLTPPPDP